MFKNMDFHSFRNSSSRLPLVGVVFPFCAFHMDHYSSLFFYRTAGWNDRGALAPCRGTASYTRGKGICSGTTNHRKWCGQLFGRFSWTHRGTISWKGVHPPFPWSSRILFHEIGKHDWVEKQYPLLLMNFGCVCSPKATSFAGLFEEKVLGTRLSQRWKIPNREHDLHWL